MATRVGRFLGREEAPSYIGRMDVRAAILVLALTLAPLARAWAQPLVHPVWAKTTAAANDDAARAQFDAALAKRGLASSEVIPRVVDTPPDQPVDPARVASLARDKGAAFVLVGCLHAPDSNRIDLRLFDANREQLRDSTAVLLAHDTDSPDMVAAILRLDEIAGRVELVRRSEDGNDTTDSRFSLALPPPQASTTPRATLATDREGWFKQHWPLVTAVGVAVGTSVVLGITVARSH